MTRRNRLAWLVCCAAVLGLAAGCQSASSQVRKPCVEMDPCAERLHELCGHFLLYYSSHKHLPDNLDELRAQDPKSLPPLVCPASGKPYVYHPRPADGLLLLDAEPCHAGRGWAITTETGATGQITLRVRLLPESPARPAN